MIELAEKLGRRDVLWMTAVPPARPRIVRTGLPRGARIRPARPSLRRRPPPASATAAPGGPQPAAPPPPPAGADTGFLQPILPDGTFASRRLGRLYSHGCAKVIPILRNIALEADNPGAARRAVFIPRASRAIPRPQSTGVDVAKVRVGDVRVAAVRELAASAARTSAKRLLEVYSSGNARGMQTAGGRSRWRARRSPQPFSASSRPRKATSCGMRRF
jgi:hypothetical protein